jgi:putative phage-type endonuclease
MGVGGVSALEVGSPGWARTVTASKVAAILGLSPWDSPRSLWHKMRGEVPNDAGNNATRRGQYLEPAILAWWRDQHGVTDDREWKDQPSYTLGGWAAATPDAACCHPVDDTVLVEAKSTAQEWYELPAYYLTQVIWQMHVSGIQRCYVPVIGPRLTFTEYVVDYADYAEDAALIERKARAFWESLANETPPPLDDTVATYDAVRRVHPEIDRGEAVELTADEAALLVTEQDIYKTTEPRLRLAKSVVIERMGRAQYATYQGVRIARRQPRGDDVTFVVVAKPSDLPIEEKSA